MVQTPLRVFFCAFQMARWMVQPPVNPVQETIEKIVAWSDASRKEWLLGLEPLVEQETAPFTRKGLQLLVDGSEPD
jgi:chemotaxis protein MotA